MPSRVTTTLAVVAGILISAFEVQAQAIKLVLQFPEGRTARYKNSYSFRYTSDNADKVVPRRDGPGNVSIVARGEWRSEETSFLTAANLDEPFLEGEVGIVGTISKADNSLEFQQQRLTVAQIPNPFDTLNGRQFTWRVQSNGHVRLFEPNFKTYELPNRAMIPELHQLWMPEYCPALPPGEVKQGDTWEATQTVMDIPGSRVKFTSSYKVKKMKDKKGSTIVEIEEKREVDYVYIINSGVMILILEGTGKGKGNWQIDATKGVVLKHKMQIDIKLPTVTKPGEETPITEVRADVRINFKRELEKLEE